MCVHAQSCPTLCNPMDCGPPGSSVHGIFQGGILEWVGISYSRGSSPPRERTCIGRQILYLESPFPIILSLYWICYNTFMFWLYWPPGMWDPSSLAGDWTPCIGRWSLNTTGPPGKFLPHLLNQVISTHLSLCVDTFNPSTNPVHLLPPTPRQSPIPYLWGGPRFRAVWRPQAPFLGGEQGVDITGR